MMTADKCKAKARQAIARALDTSDPAAKSAWELMAREWTAIGDMAARQEGAQPDPAT